MTLPVHTGSTRLAGVAGWPVAQSKSPRLHGYWLNRYGIDGAYLPLAIRPEDFTGAIRGLQAAGFRGLNVTIPHKEAAFALCDRTDAAGTAMGAVNTLIFHDDGSIEGQNTDGAGFVAHLAQTHPGFLASDSTDKSALRQAIAGSASKNILLLGAGGATRGIAFALKQALVLPDPQAGGVNAPPVYRLGDTETSPPNTQAQGRLAAGSADKPSSSATRDRANTDIIITNRTAAKAEAVAALAGAEVALWEDRQDAVRNADLIVNCTALGMTGQPPLEISLADCKPSAIIADIVYNPLETPLLAQARAAGLRTLDGIGMLLHQAAPGFEAWFGTRPEVTGELRDFVLK